MFRKRFFHPEGFTRFQENMSRNLCHVSVNSESACWATLSAALTGAERSTLNDMLASRLDYLYNDPGEFNALFPATSTLPPEFNGLRDLFFTYFIRRLPVMLRGTRLTWSRPQSPSKGEISAVCEHCIKSYAERFQAMPSDFISRWREGYRKGIGWSRWWIPTSMRDSFYYDFDVVEGYLPGSVELWLETQFPGFLRLKSASMEEKHAEQLERWGHHRAWLRANRHVFIDKLADHLHLAYPIYSADSWGAQPRRAGDAAKPRA